MYLYVMWFSITEILFLFNQSPARQLINDFKGQIVKNLENHDDFNDNCNIIIISLDTIDLSAQICSIKNNQAKSAGNDYTKMRKFLKIEVCSTQSTSSIMAGRPKKSIYLSSNYSLKAAWTG